MEIVIRDVFFTYQGTQPIEALRGINLTIQDGEYVAVVGANGSGKSTLARHLNALLLPGQGTIHVAGIDTRDPERVDLIRQHVQMIFQRPDSQIVATVVEEDVAFGPENLGVPTEQLRERVRTALDAVEMWDFRDRPPHQLSAGQKQRVAIAGALAVHPQVLILDEATTMLDPAGRASMLDLLRSLHASGRTILAITHEMEEAAEANRVIVMSLGRVIMDGTPYEIFARPAELRSAGLDLPLIADLANRLGLPVCLTVADLLAALGEPEVSAADLDPEELPSEGSSLLAEEPLISVKDLRHTYLRGTPFATEALHGVSMEAGRGQVVGLIGKTGSGKSTLMQHLNGLMRPQAGHVIVDGQDWADPSVKVTALRRKVGLLFQQPEDQLFEYYVGDDIAFGPRQQKLDPQEVRRRVQNAMAAVGLDFAAFKDRRPEELSGGEKRRAALAGVLAIEPQVLVVDEPTAGLDPLGREEILAILRGLNDSGVTILMASHRMVDIAALCDRVVALQAGKVVASGSVREVLAPTAEQTRPGDLPVSPVAQLAACLRARGWKIPQGAITLGEIETALLALAPTRFNQARQA